MNYIRITKENIDKEHICCAMSGKQSLAKKDWLKHCFSTRGLFFTAARSAENALSNIFPPKTPGYRSKRTAISILTAYGSQAR